MSEKKRGKFEYKIAGAVMSNDAWLNELGEDGWELAASVSDINGHQFVFKRHKD